MESIDIYNANLEHIGVMERLEAHLNGQWHQTFHCWVVAPDDGGKLLFQVRSAQMANFPNLLDVSAAGHLEAGETVHQGIREVSEELGVQIPPNALHELGYRVEVADQDNGQCNREYQAVYVAFLSTKLDEYQPQVEEVVGLLWLSVADGLALFSGKVESAECTGIRYDDVAGQWTRTTRTVSKVDFLPRIQNYYLTACIMASRLLRNEFPLSIS
jgi:isopentenyldiphosphate isomerase